MIPSVRYLLAVALVLQFSGVSAAWAKPCVMAPRGAEHACCVARQGRAIAHVSGACGCQLTPVPAAPAASLVFTAPEGSDHGAVTADLASAPLPVASTDFDTREYSPPGSGRDASLSHLSGSGFRC